MTPSEADSSASLKKFPRKIEISFGIVGVFSIIFFLAVVGMNWFLGDTERWADGNFKDGDLIQHYAAGTLWNQNQVEKIYRDYQLGEWINHYRNNTDPKNKIARFNGVYSPAVVWISSLFTNFSFSTWLKAWWILSSIFFAASLWLIFRFLIPKNKKIPLSVLLTAIGIPSFYYVLIPSQNTTLTLLLLCAAAWVANQNHERWAGFILSCAFYKPQFMPYLAFFIFICGNWKIVLGIILGTITWLIIGVLICGLEAHHLWFQSLAQMMRGEQFILQGLNQSWIGFFSSLYPRANPQGISIASHLIALTIALVIGNFIRFAPKKTPWPPSYTISIAFIFYIITSSYVGHYEVLLGLPWWIVYISYGAWTGQKIFFTMLFWIISLFSISGLVTGMSFTAPLLTLYLFGTLSHTINWEEIKLFFKYPMTR